MKTPEEIREHIAYLEGKTKMYPGPRHESDLIAIAWLEWVLEETPRNEVR